MKNTLTPFFVLLTLWLADATFAAPNNIKTKIVVQAVAADDFLKDAPTFIVYPEGEALRVFEQSGAVKTLEQSLERMGYSLVGTESEAVVFIRVTYTEHEPYKSEIALKERPTIDYSNAASTKNYAATLAGGRYQELANPQQNRDSNDPTSILGPSGEIIVLGDQEPNEVKVVEGDSASLLTTIHPITFQVSAWTFDKKGSSLEPNQLWAVLASYNNLRDEELQPQLLDLSKAASRFFGKTLKKEKFISR